MTRNHWFALLTLLVLLPTESTLAQLGYGDLIGVDQHISGDAWLVSVDPLAGTTTPLAPLDITLTDLAHDPTTGIVYGVEATLDGVVRVDLDSGEFQLVGPPSTPNPEFLTIAVDPNTGTIYTTNYEGLYTVDPNTGSATLVSSATIPTFASLTFDAATGQLYGFERILSGVVGGFVVNLYRVDPLTGSYTYLGDGGNFFGLEFSPAGELYACDTGDSLSPPAFGPSSLSTIDPADGSVLSTTTLDADNLLAITFLLSGVGPSGFQRADANSDTLVDVSDAIFLLSALFVPGSPTPACEDASDVNDDGAMDISDAIYLLASLFVPGSPLPPEPTYPTCGDDPTADSLDCATPTCP